MSTYTNGTAPLRKRLPVDSAEERRRVHHEGDVVIVGAGVAGCALAVALGNQGRSVILLEKSLKEPDRIVGELLQPGGVEALEKLGLRNCLEDIDAIRVLGYYITFMGDDDVHIPYPNRKKEKTQFEGRSFHHGRFIVRLREAAMAHPNVTVVETKVVSLVQSTHSEEVLGVECLSNGEKDFFFAPLTFVVDGYASTFRKQYLPHTPRAKSKFWGLELIDANLPAPFHGHIVLTDGPPVLLYQIGSHETRILMDVPENLPSASVQNGGVKGHMRNKVLPSLPKSVQPSFLAALEKGQLRSMPNSFLPPTVNKTRGLIFLGDAMNMRHPLTGGGMTVALTDVIHICDLLSPENVPNLTKTDQVLKQMTRFHWKRKNTSSVINILAQALYSLFAADNSHLKVLQRGCFRYFKLGMYEEPVSMLAGIIGKPFTLFRHFYTVAFLSIGLHLIRSPIYLIPVAIIQCFFVFAAACRVILPFIFAEMKS